MGPIDNLRKAQENLITIEDTLLFLQKKYSYSRKEAAEVLFHLLPDEENFRGQFMNPSFFGKKIGIATFSHVVYEPNIYQLLRDIIADKDCAFEALPISDDSDVPF